MFDVGRHEPLASRRVAHLVRANVLVKDNPHNEPSGRQSRESDPATRRESTDADPDPVMSGADAVEKTTYVADVHGADVGDAATRGVPVTATVPSGGTSPIVWIAAILAALALVAYAAALFT